MNTTSPLISVVMPLYNKRDYVEASIQSVANQTFRDFELIIIDDGSTDGSAEVAQTAWQDAKYVHQVNSGPSAARNKGVELAKGQYVAFLDADDVWAHDKLRIQVAYLKDNPELDWCASNYVVVDPDANTKTLARQGLNGEWIVYENWFKANADKYMILTSGVIVRRDAILSAGGFDTTIPAGQDVDLWMRVATNSPRYAFCTKPLFDYMDISGSVSTASAKRFQSATHLMKKHIKLSVELNDENYQAFVKSKCQSLMKVAIAHGIPDCVKSIVSAMPETWKNCTRIKRYHFLSRFPASLMRTASYVWRAMRGKKQPRVQ